MTWPQETPAAGRIGQVTLSADTAPAASITARPGTIFRSSRLPRDPLPVPKLAAPAAPLPAGSSGGLVAADPAGAFVYADSGGNAFTFAAGAASFGAGSGSRGSLGDLKIVPGRAVMLAAGAVSTQTVT